MSSVGPSENRREDQEMWSGWSVKVKVWLATWALLRMAGLGIVAHCRGRSLQQPGRLWRAFMNLWPSVLLISFSPHVVVLKTGILSWSISLSLGCDYLFKAPPFCSSIEVRLVLFLPILLKMIIIITNSLINIRDRIRTTVSCFYITLLQK